MQRNPSQSLPHPPLPPGWTAQWDPTVGRHAFIEAATGRSQFNFPFGAPLPPAQGRPMGAHHGSRASISGPMSSYSPPVHGGGPGGPFNGMQRGHMRAGSVANAGAPRLPGAVPMPQFSPHRQTPPVPEHQASPGAGPGGAAAAQAVRSPPPPQPQLGVIPPQPQQQQQPPPPQPRVGRRQYAANTAAYIAGDPNLSAPSTGAAGGSSHSHSQSQSFFSPATGFQDPSANNNSAGGGGNFFSPGAPGAQPDQYGAGAGGAAAAQGYGRGGAAPGPGGPGFAGAGAGAAQAMSNQFGQMNLGGGQKVQASVSTMNLIGLPLHPAELMSMPPPPVNLPPHLPGNLQASFSTSETRNADPSYQRATINAVPTTNSLLNKSKLPLALVLTPYRSLKPNDPEVPVVSDTVIARCRRCRTYINPFVTFIEGGQRWKCCMCNLSNEVPQLFDWDQEKNAPADRYARAELNSSVVEFIAPTEYMVRPPQPPLYIFLIDVSYSAVTTGMVATAARTLLESLDRLPNDDGRTKIAIIGVDSCLHFFSLPAGATEPSMLVVGDLDEVFLPKPSDILVNLVEARSALESLLSRLSDMFKDTHNVGNALGAGLQAAFKLVSQVGGKVIALTSSLPNIGPGALKNREDSKVLGTTKESALLQPQTGFYKSFAIECSRSQVSVDMWLFASAYTDVATLSGLPRYTGGQTYFYPSFNAARSEDALKFAHEFGTVIADPIALEAVMRVRASKGIRMSAFHGNFFVRSTDLLSLAAVPMDQSYAIEIQIEDPISAPFVVFQTAVLHTTCYGERRIRVVTQALPTTSSLSELYANVDTVAMATLLADKAVERCMQAKLEDARDAIMNKLIDILGTYKATMTSSGSGASPQLVCAENMKFLPLLMLGLIKHIGLRQSAMIPSDLRAYAQALLTTLPSQLLIPYLHPVFYSLHNMPKECGTIGDQGVVLPIPLPLSSERLERHGLFLIEDGQNVFLWLGRDAVPQLVLDVFDVPSYAELRGGKMTLPVLDNAFSQRVNAIIGKVREARRGPYYAHLYVVKEDGDPALRQWALSLLIEDRMEGLPSYQQFLGQLKDRINDKSF
ncbi:BZ3500_MvSof-1268-A1-R1_Chr3-1g05521 [Microbotryum saponariae]|uniref:BZ3500_MvSof-1268-A1-R1_Chr3-1g05521 protein n=1 Tax=Microbotryum saponariae TaxID=289078 RepID=A0A2X0LQZ4_9BASI|nr:BZ3500_MvSof-1268-A1-R1_Chr3-1g05521 [Microbotryum saponariae]SDA04712.1 BZ3501_MvSof-1269-A2-R1_Chr3-1g05192 [Microbotryum saponariae]